MPKLAGKLFIIGLTHFWCFVHADAKFIEALSDWNIVALKQSKHQSNRSNRSIENLNQILLKFDFNLRQAQRQVQGEPWPDFCVSPVLAYFYNHANTNDNNHSK